MIFRTWKREYIFFKYTANYFTTILVKMNCAFIFENYFKALHRILFVKHSVPVTVVIATSQLISQLTRPYVSTYIAHELQFQRWTSRYYCYIIARNVTCKTLTRAFVF